MVARGQFWCEKVEKAKGNEETLLMLGNLKGASGKM